MLEEKNESGGKKGIREYCAEALFLIMQKKTFLEISDTEIIAKAGISRSSFYKHFRIFKEDIVKWHIRPLAKSTQTRENAA